MKIVLLLTTFLIVMILELIFSSGVWIHDLVLLLNGPCLMLKCSIDTEIYSFWDIIFHKKEFTFAGLEFSENLHQQFWNPKKAPELKLLKPHWSGTPCRFLNITCFSVFWSSLNSDFEHGHHYTMPWWIFFYIKGHSSC